MRVGAERTERRRDRVDSGRQQQASSAGNQVSNMAYSISCKMLLVCD